MNDYIITLDSMGGTHLEHRSHKYITRKWKNGRWVYTYPEDEYSKKIKTKNNTNKLLMDLTNDNLKLMTYENSELKRIGKETGYKHWDPNDGKKVEVHLADGRVKTVDPSDKAIVNASRLMVSYKRDTWKNDAELARYNRKKYETSIKKWESEPISKIQTYVNKAKDSINKYLSKMTKRIKKTAENVSSSFSSSRRVGY